MPEALNVIIDISHHDGNVNLAKAKEDGILGVIQKATQGQTFKDPTYKRNPVRRQSSARALCPNTDTVDVDLAHSSVFNHPNQDLAKNIGVCPPSPPTPSSRVGA